MGRPEGSPATAVRREPPRFRRVEVLGTEHLSSRMVRVTFAGPELAGLSVDEPAASVRLLLPSRGMQDLVMPTWNGNEFLLTDGRRPVIRTFTPYGLDRERLELDLLIVIHGTGAASAWAETVRPGDPAAISGPGRGYRVPHDAPAFLLAGDETAIPAMVQLLLALPTHSRIETHVEVATSAARLPLPDRPGATVEWHEAAAASSPGDALVEAVAGAALPTGVRVWAAGEAAAMQRIRRHAFQERRLPRAQTTVRGYWKHGRAGDAEKRPMSGSE